MELSKRILYVIILISLFFGIGSLYDNNIQQLEFRNLKLKEENKQLESVIKEKDSIISSLINADYKLKAQDLKHGNIFRIYKRDIMIESDYDIDTMYVNKIYNIAEAVEVEPWLQLYFAHLENRFSPFDKKNKNEIVRSTKDAFNIMQVTRSAMNEVNRVYGTKYKWDRVKLDPQKNIEVSALYIKYHVLPAFYAFNENADIGYYFYNGSPKYAEKMLKHKGKLDQYIDYKNQLEKN